MIDIRHIMRLDTCIPAMVALLLLLSFSPCIADNSSRVADMLASDDAATRAQGLEVVRETGQPLMPGLITALSSNDTNRRRGAAMALSLLPVPALTVDGLILGLSDNDPVVRSLCAHGLGKIGRPAAVRTAQLLTHSDNRVRVGAALALSKMGTEAIPALTAMLQLQDPHVTAKAAWLLGVMGPDAMSAVPALIRAMETDDMRVLHVLAETIDIIGPEPAMVYHELTMLGRDQVNCPATRIGKAAAPSLVKLLARPGTPMANIALYTLARMGSTAEPALKLALATGNASQQTAAALLLTGIDPKLAHSLPEDLRHSLAGALKTD